MPDNHQSRDIVEMVAIRNNSASNEMVKQNELHAMLTRIVYSFG